MSARHFLADDDGNPLVYFDGEQFWIGEPFDVRGPRPGELLMRDEFSLTRIADKDLIRRDVTYLENVLEDASQYITNEQMPGWVWYHWQTLGEEMKRALVYGGLVRLPGRGRMRSPNMHADTSEPNLEIDRHRFFESPGSRAISDSGLSIIGGMVTFDGQGTADSRAASLKITRANSSLDTLTRIWAGFRELNEGVSGFQPIWDLHDGTVGYANSDSAKISDSNAYGGHTVEVSFASVGDEYSRCYETILQAYGGADQSHARGKYLVLLRWSGTTSSEFAIRMAIDIAASNDQLRFTERKYVLGQGTGTYDVLPLGIIDIPPMGGKRVWNDDSLDGLRFSLYAELVTGSVGNDLRLNTLTFIPVGRDLKSEDANILYGFFKADIECLPTDRFTGVAASLVDEDVAAEIGVSGANFYAPRGGGMLVVACAGAASQVDDGTMDIDLELVDRWRTYRRGGEASW